MHINWFFNHKYHFTQYTFTNNVLRSQTGEWEGSKRHAENILLLIEISALKKLSSTSTVSKVDVKHHKN